MQGKKFAVVSVSHFAGKMENFAMVPPLATFGTLVLMRKNVDPVWA